MAEAEDLDVPPPYYSGQGSAGLCWPTRPGLPSSGKVVAQYRAIGDQLYRGLRQDRTTRGGALGPLSSFVSLRVAASQ